MGDDPAKAAKTVTAGKKSVGGGAGGLCSPRNAASHAGCDRLKASREGEHLHDTAGLPGACGTGIKGAYPVQGQTVRTSAGRFMKYFLKFYLPRFENWVIVVNVSQIKQNDI